MKYTWNSTFIDDVQPVSGAKMIGSTAETAPPADRSWFAHVVALVTLSVIGLLAYGLFFAPAIFMDDWTSVVERIITDNAQWLDLTQRRPLLFSTFLLQNRLFGLNITAYYASLWLMYLAMTAVVYAIVASLPLPRKHLFALVVAALFLVYPTTYTHMWLIMFGVYCGTLLTLVYGYFLLKFAQGGGWLLFGLALVCLLLPLGVYEGQLGVAAAWAIILFLLSWRAPRARWLSLLLPVLLAGLYAVWRTLGYSAIGVSDSYLTEMSVSPAVLLSRLLLGYKVTLGWGWTQTIAAFLPWAASAKVAVLLLGSVVIGLGVLVWAVTRKRASNDASMWDEARWPAKGGVLVPYLIALAVGMLLVGAGYFPTTAVFLPTLAGIGSRFNLFATIGGAVTIAAVLMLVALLVARTPKQAQWLLLGAVTPYILVGILTQASVQYHNRIAWQEQQSIWQSLFVAAPDFADDTLVLFVLPGFEDRSGFSNWRRTPLSASWEASSGVRLLYNNPTLTADVHFPDIDEPIEPVLTRDGVLTRDTAVLTPYSRVVAFMFDPGSGAVSRLAQLPAEMVQDAEAPVDLCAECVLATAVMDAPLRELIRD